VVNDIAEFPVASVIRKAFEEEAAISEKPVGTY
jgi:hypothetical protein